ncbi:MAG: cytochrome C oxidase subunit IV family protein [Cryomorphaceae bacterium]|jgi:cytochrome c oxidase subunit IV|nr:cytochrome C oxidase subunit IV family protein [Cryomorphaceae bacterium]MDG1888803.1 cytochrome C oxidase subunit IV family protein [Flavobacteriaceae bacterium]MBT3502940.1 cytochrome C oxidase subunit IV family protein [Cryomorphaceae bacterium]MBT3688870.1 cytochrome C oxidase subunit IV family protein [Cryomorphaceae bacterium]MBT4222602.1 cytochrome C oxidase subunit IV family protein [Cryomorphaceae bacterium]
MADHNHKLEIFRGRLKFKSNVQKIWGVLIFLSIVTVIEVALGISKPKILLNYFLGIKLINWLFIIMTLIKAYYITWDFMHVRDEKAFLKNTIVVPLLILIPFLLFILLIEGSYIFDVMLDGLKTWKI